MKKIFTQLFLFSLSLVVLTSCEDVVDLDIKSGNSQLVVDGWVTNQATEHTIRLTESAPYFDNTPAKPVLNASVIVTDDKGKVFTFKDVKNNGYYVWKPTSAKDTLGRVGGTYTLNVKFGTEEYTAVSKLNRVPKIDSMTYFFDKLPVAPSDGSPKEGYKPEFFARDFTGEGDCYWIKSYRNGKYYNKASDISTAYDAAFSPGANSDGLIFILPIRQSVVPQLEFALEKDTVKVELQSVSLAGYYFLNQVRIESTNGGLFATAPSNIFTNINNINPNGRKALGFFGAAGVSTFQTVIDAKKAKPKNG
ncbi:DUF4249 domain-containing protein [Runella sp.]|uniref:DUF4249 domain-containing protein n=1 Tax=Runella sp. TaxID=1960881 RepID=UPI003D13163E